MYKKFKFIFFEIGVLNVQRCKNNFIQLLYYYEGWCKKEYKRGEEFIKHSNYFDKYSNKYYNLLNRRINNYNYGVWGGIIKRSFFFNNFFRIKLSEGYHWLTTLDNKHIDHHYVKEYSRLEYLLHFKFIKPNFHGFIKKRIANNQDWDNSSEYKNLKNVNISELYNKKFSVELKNKSQLDSIFNKLVFNKFIKYDILNVRRVKINEITKLLDIDMTLKQGDDMCDLLDTLIIDIQG